MNVTERNKNLRGQQQNTPAHAIGIRFGLNDLMKYGLGVDDESTKQIVYGR